MHCKKAAAPRFRWRRHSGQFRLALLPGLVYVTSWPSLRPSSWRPSSSWGPPSSLRLSSLLPWLLPPFLIPTSMVGGIGGLPTAAVRQLPWTFAAV